jgi:RimJ/RimL family protein N-acetyltransferase
LLRVARKYNIKRVQTAVRSDFDKGIRFAKWLGLENEGLMKHYGFDGSDQYRYARIF